MRSLAAAVMAGGVVLMGAGGAHAQQARDDGMDCVYLELGENYELVAEVLLYDDVSDAQINEAASIVEAAKKTCAGKFTYTEGQLFTVGELGVYVSALDYLSDELIWGGATETAVEGVLDYYLTLSDEDYDLLFDPTWRSNAEFYAKLRAAVVAKGVPPDDDSVDVALTMLEVSAMTDEAMILFELDDALSEDDAQ